MVKIVLTILIIFFSIGIFSQSDEKACIKAAHKTFSEETKICNDKKGEERKACVKVAKDKLDTTRKECSAKNESKEAKQVK